MAKIIQFFNGTRKWQSMLKEGRDVLWSCPWPPVWFCLAETFRGRPRISWDLELLATMITIIARKVKPKYLREREVISRGVILDVICCSLQDQLWSMKSTFQFVKWGESLGKEYTHQSFSQRDVTLFPLWDVAREGKSRPTECET